MLSMLSVLAGIALLYLVRLIWQTYTHPLRTIKGPILARYTNWWRLIDASRGHSDVTLANLHKQHGQAVRLGPNTISLSDPRMIKVVYNVKAPWKKSDMYAVNDVIVQGRRYANLFSTRDEEWHGKILRPVRSLYAMSSVSVFEPALDHVIKGCFKQLERRYMGSNAGRASFDASVWMDFCIVHQSEIGTEIVADIATVAWDAMGEVTFGKQFGFLTGGKDIKGILQKAKTASYYFTVIAQIPQLDMWLEKNRVFRMGPPDISWTSDFARTALAERLERNRTGNISQSDRKDFLDYFLAAQRDKPDVVDDGLLINYLLINLFAGGDTTAITLGATIYYVLKHPEVYKKLRLELDNTELSYPAKWSEARNLPYLNAVLNEAARLHAGVGMILERVVPSGGCALPDGRFIPEGSIIGMNPWIIHRNTDYFGRDANVFNPNRYLKTDDESDEQFAIRSSKMKQANLTFGSGVRTCLGKNLSRFESTKFIATMFAYYDLALVNPKKEFEVYSAFFMYHSGVDVTINKREVNS